MAFAAYLLEGTAKDFSMVERTWQAEVGTWDSFVTEFYNRFIPEGVREDKAEEFLLLRQRGMSVVEYEAEFSRLSRFGAQYVPPYKFGASSSEEAGTACGTE